MNANPKMPVPSARTSQYWLNLAVAGLLLFYVLYVAWQAVTPGLMCIELANDYCEYIRAGSNGNASNLGWIASIPHLLQAPADTSQRLAAQWPHILPYAPVFVLPFQLLAYMKPEVSYWIWAALNLAAMFFYLRFFARRLNLPPLSIQQMAMIFACLPVFLNLLAGQVDVWLMICVGEMLRAMLERKSFKAGLWISGLLLKPQMLILFGILLLVQRAWRTLAGLAASSSVLGLVSFVLVGPGGIVRIWDSWTQAAQGPGSEWAEGMMNWRMISTHLANIMAPWLGGIVAAAGMLVIAGLCLYAWRRPFHAAQPVYTSTGLLGVLTATALVSWHSHIHMAMILIPPIVYLYLTDRLSRKVTEFWFLMPALLFVAMVFIPETMMYLNIIPLSARSVIFFLLGACEFSLNLYLFSWALRQARQSYASGGEYSPTSLPQSVTPG